jgi:hypothetical protein
MKYLQPMSSLPSLVCRVRYAHTTNQTPRQKMATPLFGFVHPPPSSERVYHIDKKENGKLTITNKKNSKKKLVSPSANGRFCEMAAVTPQKRQWELGSYYPAGSSVKPPPRKAAGTLSEYGGQ